jgi:hypothetical protein
MTREHAKKEKVSVKEYALIKRVNRIIGKTGRKLMKNHPARTKKGRRRLTDREQAFGTYFVVRTGEGDGLDERVVKHHVDLEGFSRECGALEAYEFLDIEKTYGRE